MQRIPMVVVTAIVLIGIGIPALVLAGVSVPFGLLWNLSVQVREHRLRGRLRAAGRFPAWTEVAGHLSRGEGTLIVEQANKDGTRFWWTPDVVASRAPAPPPASDALDFMCPDPAHPFVAWCLAHYTSPSRGSAHLTAPTHLSFPPGFIESRDLTALFPDARVIISVLVGNAG